MSVKVGDIIFRNIAGNKADVIVYMIKKKVDEDEFVADYIRRNRSLFPVDVPYLQIIRNKRISLAEVEQASKLTRQELTQFKCETIEEIFEKPIDLEIRLPKG